MITTNPSSRRSAFDVGTVSGDRVDDVLKKARLDFDVDLVPIKNPVTGADILTSGGTPRYFSTVRRDTQHVLGVVEGRFVVTPNRDVFALAEMLQEEERVTVTSAFAIDNGSRCFVTLEWPKKSEISVVGDIVARRVILSNAHNGKYTTSMRLIPFRLACKNGLVVPVPSGSFEFKIRHTKSSDDRIKEYNRTLFSASKYFSSFSQMAERMAQTKVTNTHANRLITQIFGENTKDSERKSSEVLDLFNGGQAGFGESVRNTAWGLLNAVSEYAEHRGRIRLVKGETETIQRFKSVYEGSAHRIKLKAMEVLTKDKELGLSFASLN